MAFTPGTLSDVLQTLGGTWRVFFYATDDPFATIIGAGYFLHVRDRGVKSVGDLIEVYSSTDGRHYTLSVTALDAAGTATVALEAVDLSLLAAGTVVAPSLASVIDRTTGIWFPAARQVEMAADGQRGWLVRNDPDNPGEVWIGHSEDMDSDFSPLFRLETAGRSKVRLRSMIIADPGDSSEIGIYAGNGTPEAPVRQEYVGQWAHFSYVVPITTGLDNPGELVISNKNRLIKPHRVTTAMGIHWTATTYIPSLVSIPDGFPLQLKLEHGVTGGATTDLNFNSLGAHPVKRASGSALSSPFFQSPTLGNGNPIEITVLYNLANTEWRLSANSDNVNGRTDRFYFQNPNYARGAVDGFRHAESPTETGRAMTHVWAVSRIGEAVHRDQMWLHPTGAFIAAGLATYEGSATEFGYRQDQLYPGRMHDSSGADFMWPGDAFSGTNRQVNSHRTAGWGNVSIPATDIYTLGFSAIAIRNATHAGVGLNVDYDVPNNRVLFACVNQNNSDSVEDLIPGANNLVLVKATAHGLKDRDSINMSGVVGVSEANGEGLTIKVLDADWFYILGAYHHASEAYVSGGTFTKATRSERGGIDVPTGVWFLGGDLAGATVRITPSTSGVSHLEFESLATGNGIRLTAEGSDTNIPITIRPKGTSTVIIPIASIQAFADDAAAATGLIPVGGVYRTGSALKIRAS